METLNDKLNGDIKIGMAVCYSPSNGELYKVVEICDKKIVLEHLLPVKSKKTRIGGYIEEPHIGGYTEETHGYKYDQIPDRCKLDIIFMNYRDVVKETPTEIPTPKA